MKGTRRSLVGGMAAGASLMALAGGPPTAAQAQIGRKTFVLVHGSSAGGWCYRRVADLLEKAGHKVYAPTLTGLGERSHLMSGLITLDTHITDVVNVIRWENLEDFVLVGHSYGGWIISGVAEQVEGKISSIVFLDAFMPENGQRVLDTNSPRSRAEIEQAQKKAEVSRPAPPASVWKVNEKDQPWVNEKFTAQPIGVAFTPVRLTGARVIVEAAINNKRMPPINSDGKPASEAQPERPGRYHVRAISQCGPLLAQRRPLGRIPERRDCAGPHSAGSA
jgi:pimeloyl-ACP methyl ester carboxylesterase